MYTAQLINYNYSSSIQQCKKLFSQNNLPLFKPVNRHHINYCIDGNGGKWERKKKWILFIDLPKFHYPEQYFFYNYFCVAASPNWFMWDWDFKALDCKKTSCRHQGP